MGETPREPEEILEEKSEPKSYADRMKESLEKEQDIITKHVAELKRIGEKAKGGELLTPEERAYLKKASGKTDRYEKK